MNRFFSVFALGVCLFTGIWIAVTVVQDRTRQHVRVRRRHQNAFSKMPAGEVPVLRKQIHHENVHHSPEEVLLLKQGHGQFARHSRGKSQGQLPRIEYGKVSASKQGSGQVGYDTSGELWKIITLK